MFGESQRGHLRFSGLAVAAAGVILELLEVVQEIGEEEGVILDSIEILLLSPPPISVVFPAKSSWIIFLRDRSKSKCEREIYREYCGDGSKCEREIYREMSSIFFMVWKDGEWNDIYSNSIKRGHTTWKQLVFFFFGFWNVALASAFWREEKIDHSWMIDRWKKKKKH